MEQANFVFNYFEIIKKKIPDWDFFNLEVMKEHLEKLEFDLHDCLDLIDTRIDEINEESVDI